MEFRPNGKELPVPETAVVFYAEDDGSSPLLS
jgi:hypothetical protein